MLQELPDMEGSLLMLYNQFKQSYSFLFSASKTRKNLKESLSGLTQLLQKSEVSQEIKSLEMKMMLHLAFHIDEEARMGYIELAHGAIVGLLEKNFLSNKNLEAEWEELTSTRIGDLDDTDESEMKHIQQFEEHMVERLGLSEVIPMVHIPGFPSIEYLKDKEVQYSQIYWRSGSMFQKHQKPGEMSRIELDAQSVVLLDDISDYLVPFSEPNSLNMLLDFSLERFHIPALWSHHTQFNSGVVVEFCKKSLLENNQSFHI